jgi:deoxyribose-phosphate aldolase
MQLSKYIDHTLLRPTATEADILVLCREAIEYNFYAVCVNGCYVERCVQELSRTETKVAAVVGFPLGAMASQVKLAEATQAIEEGAQEIDMVMNLGWLKEQYYSKVEQEISAIKKSIGTNVLKVIVETCYLSEEEKKTITQLIGNAGADFIKTSTGFGTGGATLEDVLLMKSEKTDKLRIKASGGIKDYSSALKFIEAGADRIGTSSGIAIVTDKQGAISAY